MADALLASIDDPDQFNSSSLSKLDESLRCPICSELFKGAVLLQCLHSFCSECIRDALSVKVPPRCPVCSAESDQGRIRINPALDDAVRFWREARPRVLELDTAPPPTASTSRGPSRARSAVASSSLQLDSSDDELIRMPPQSTRSAAAGSKSSSKKGKALAEAGSSDVEIVADATPHRPSKRQKTEEVNLTDPKAVVECPICHSRMANAKVGRHIDRCDGTKKDDPPAKSNTGWAGFMSSTQAPKNVAQQPSKLLARRTDDGRPVHLPLISYTASTLKSLKTKLEELGLSTSTPPAAKTPAHKIEVYKRRHREFTLKWNANCDVHPADNRHKTEAQLKDELRQWENRQDRSEKKDIGDKDEWQKSNVDQFRALTAKARASVRAARQTKEESLVSAVAEDATRTSSAPPSEDVSMGDDAPVAQVALPPVAPAEPSSPTPATEHTQPLEPATAQPGPIAPLSPPAARRSTRTRTVAFAEEPARARRSQPAEPADEDDSDSMDEEGQLKMPRPSQRVREEEELWKRRQAEAEAGLDGDESSGSEGEVVPLGGLESEEDSEAGLA